MSYSTRGHKTTHAPQTRGQRKPNLHCRAPSGSPPCSSHTSYRSMGCVAIKTTVSKADFLVTGHAGPGQGCGLCASCFPRVNIAPKGFMPALALVT